MADKFKSIFRRKTFEKLYYVGITDWVNISPNYCLCTHGRTDKLTSCTENVEISDEEIGRYDIEIPLLEVGDEFFLHDIQKVVVIKSRLRSSDGSITYYVEDVTVETENTQKSKEIADKKVEKWNHEEEEIQKLKKEFEDYKREYKYKNRFFNRKHS